MDASVSGKAVKAGSNCHELSRGHRYEAKGARMVCGDCEAVMPARVVDALPVVVRPAMPPRRACVCCGKELSSAAMRVQRVICWSPECASMAEEALRRAGGTVPVSRLRGVA